MKILRLFALAAIVLLTSCATNGLEGTWSCASATVNGKPLPDATVARLRLTLMRERYKTEKGTEVLFDSTYTLDPSKNPKQIDMVGTEGDLKGKQALGIYSVQNGTLEICYTMPGKGRPSKFESTPGSEAYLIIWKRQKP